MKNYLDMSPADRAHMGCQRSVKIKVSAKQVKKNVVNLQDGFSTWIHSYFYTG